jgi:hypothetical protein
VIGTRFGVQQLVAPFFTISNEAHLGSNMKTSRFRFQSYRPLIVAITQVLPFVAFAQSVEDDASKMARPLLHTNAQLFVFEIFPSNKVMHTYFAGRRIRLLDSEMDMKFYVTPAPEEKGAQSEP